VTRTDTTLGRYRLLDRLGAGGMGEVWRAHDANVDREVAIKLLAPGAVSDATTTERFRREALALSRLSHPGVATIFDFDVHTDMARSLEALGRFDEAFAWLETAIAEKASGVIWLRMHPRLDPIRNDPRYWPMVERVGLGDGGVVGR
jgi:serine/threonine protein kinase